METHDVSLCKGSATPLGADWRSVQGKAAKPGGGEVKGEMGGSEWSRMVEKTWM